MPADSFEREYTRDLAVDTRRFHRTVVTVEILSEEPLNEDWQLGDVAAFIQDGHASGVCDITQHEVVDARTITKLLTEQGSDPNFLLMYD